MGENKPGVSQSRIIDLFVNRVASNRLVLYSSVSLIPLLMVVFIPALDEVAISKEIPIVALVIGGLDFYYFNRFSVLRFFKLKREDLINIIHYLTDPECLYESMDRKQFLTEHKVFSCTTLVYSGLTVTFIILFILIPTGSWSYEYVLIGSIISSFIVLASVTRFYITKRKIYPYFLAKAHFTLGEQAKSSSEMFSRFIEGLEAYNDYLQRNFKVRINALQRFYSSMAGKTVEQRHCTIENILEHFNVKGSDIDYLGTLREISKIIDEDQKIDLLTSEDFKRKIQNWIQVIGIAIPLLVVFIEVMTGNK